jgi:hypothetical protein
MGFEEEAYKFLFLRVKTALCEELTEWRRHSKGKVS